MSAPLAGMRIWVISGGGIGTQRAKLFNQIVSRLGADVCFSLAGAKCLLS